MSNIELKEPRLHSRYDANIEPSSTNCAFPEKKYLGFFPTADLSILRLRQSIISALLNNSPMTQHLTEFTQEAEKHLQEVDSLRNQARYVQTTEERDMCELLAEIALMKVPANFPPDTANEYINYWLSSTRNLFINTTIAGTSNLEIRKFHTRSLNSEILNTLRYTSLFTDIVSHLGKFKLPRSNEAVSFKQADIVEDQVFIAKGIVPFYADNLVGKPVPMDIVLEPGRFAGGIIVGPNCSGKSTFLDGVQTSLYFGSMTGSVPALGETSIGWLPSDLIRVTPEPATAIGLFGNDLGKGHFQRVVHRIYEDLLHRSVNTDTAILLIDDLLEGITDSSGVVGLFKNLSELHDKEGLYMLSVIRERQLAELITQQFPFQRIGITADHQVIYGEYPEESTATGIVDDAHQQYMKERAYKIARFRDKPSRSSSISG